MLRRRQVDLRVTAINRERSKLIRARWKTSVSIGPLHTRNSLHTHPGFFHLLESSDDLSEPSSEMREFCSGEAQKVPASTTLLSMHARSNKESKTDESRSDNLSVSPGDKSNKKILRANFKNICGKLIRKVSCLHYQQGRHRFQRHVGDLETLNLTGPSAAYLSKPTQGDPVPFLLQRGVISANDDSLPVVCEPEHTVGTCRIDSSFQPSPPSTFALVMRYRGVKITVVSKELKILVVNMLPSHTCDYIRFITQLHVNHMDSIGRRDMTFRALYTYTKLDIPCCEISGLHPILKQVSSMIIGTIAHVFESPDALELMPRSWREPHMLMYDHHQKHTGAPMHYDGSDWTWNLMLSHNDDYVGGGTYIRALRKTIVLRQGQVLIHPGNLYHKGVNIAAGTRQLIVSFLDGYSSNVCDPSAAEMEQSCFECHRISI